MRVSEIPREVAQGPFRRWLEDLRTGLSKVEAPVAGKVEAVPYAMLAQRKPRLDACVVAYCPDHPEGACLVASTANGWMRLSFSGPA